MIELFTTNNSLLIFPLLCFQASSFGSAHSRAWLRKHFPDYQPPEGLGQHGKKGSYDGGPKL